jgi:hypothetical protein
MSRTIGLDEEKYEFQNSLGRLTNSARQGRTVAAARTLCRKSKQLSLVQTSFYKSVSLEKETDAYHPYTSPPASLRGARSTYRIFIAILYTNLLLTRDLFDITPFTFINVERCYPEQAQQLTWS